MAVTAMLASVVMTGCAPGGPDPVTPGAAADVVASTGSAATAVPREPAHEVEAASRSVRVATGQPCTARLHGTEAPAAVGVAPQELATLVLDRADLGAEGPEWTREDFTGGYMDNPEVASGPMGLRPRACAELRRDGRLLGYASSWWDTTGVGPVPQITETVHLFGTAAGAHRLLVWTSQRGSSATDVPGLGDEAVRLVRTTSDGGRMTDVLARWGQWVVHVFENSPNGAPRRDLQSIARAGLARLSDATLTDEPYDVAAFLSAPLPRSTYGPRFRRLTWDWFFGGCHDAYEVASNYAEDPDAEASRLAGLGFLMSCQALYSRDRPLERVNSTVVLLASPEAADAYLADRVDAARESGPGVQPGRTFPVSSPPGAVGIVRRVDPGLRMTEVLVPHGDVVGRVFVQTSSRRDRTGQVARWARALALRLDDYLGAR